MKDEILDFWEDHRKLCIVIILVIVLVIALFAIRNSNMKKKAAAEAEAARIAAEQAALAQDQVPIEEPKDDYQNMLGLDADKWRDERVTVKPDENKPDETPVVVKRTPRYPVDVNVFSHTEVPKKNMDGSSCKDYYNKVTLADFGTYWGTALTAEDFAGNTRYFVGVAEENYNPLNNLESSGWLISHLSELKPNDVIQFTNLHVIGSLSRTHVALLCSYDWYSAFGLDDTLIVFEDISKTLDLNGFKDGDIFSATVFVHNIKVVNNVAGKRVIVCEYATYDESLYGG